MLTPPVTHEPASAGAPRPRIHFTPSRGWINDPYGVHRAGSHYVLYYQALPDQLTWSPELSWGSAVSQDLVHWQESGPALVPQPFESGCWSGCVVADDLGGGLAFYTRIHSDEMDLSHIAVARQDASGLGFHSNAGDIVITGPPPGSGLVAFRDPFVWRQDDGWLMIVGAGHGDGTGAILLYSSHDLLRWEHVGMLCQGRIDSERPAQNEVWECPQMVRVGDKWVLIVSVMKNHRADHVAAAVGTFDGKTFTHQGWQRLAHGPVAYATSAFRDADNRPCLLSWLRDESAPSRLTPKWVGAHSVVSVLRLGPRGELLIGPHPALNSRVPTLAMHVEASGTIRLNTDGFQYPQRILLPPSGGKLELGDSSGIVQLAICASEPRKAICVIRPHLPDDVLQWTSLVPIEILIDHGIIEVFAGEAYGVWRFA